MCGMENTGIKTSCSTGGVEKLLVLFGGIAYSRKSEPSIYRSGYYVNDDAIRAVLKATRRKVYDRDGDGVVNCIDFTITFKKEWDKVMPPNQCEIVRCYNVEGRGTMNHLFMRVRLERDGEWLYVEPQARYYRNNYCMSDFWGFPMYNPRYNFYEETDIWLSECVQ